VDPSVILLHGSQASQVPGQPPNYAGDASGGFKDEAPLYPFLLSHVAGLVPGDEIEGAPHNFDA
jgi:hypothetical protein